MNYAAKAAILFTESVKYGPEDMVRGVFVSICLVLSIAAGAAAQSGWRGFECDVEGDLVGVFFQSSERGWVAGDNGYLASTRDGGKTWTRIDLNITDDINEVYFRNDKDGFVVAGRKLFVTRDGGQTWQDIRPYRTGEFGSGTPEFLSVKFSDRRRGYIIGSVLRGSGDDAVVVDSLLMRTEDGGDTWRRVLLPFKLELFSIFFRGNSHGWIVGDDGTVLASRDEGLTWTRQNTGTKEPLYGIDFRDQKNGVAVGKNGTIIQSTNGGDSWWPIQSPVRDSLMRVSFADDKNGWIAGHRGTILRTRDRGKTWERSLPGTNNHLYGIFMDKKYGWAVGADGTLLRYFP